MTEIALNPAAPAALAPATQFTVDLQMWAAELSAAHSIGKALASTDFVPMTLKTKSGGAMKEYDQIAENVAACVLAGKALGLDPMNSIQNIFIVHGRPAMYARTMVALVLNAGHEVERVAATEQRVAYRARRNGKGEWQTFEWTIERAAKAGYLSNKKYASDPIAMLTAKAQAEACRIIAPDVLTGIAATSVEEVQLEDLGETGEQQQAAPAASQPKRTMTRRQQPAPAAPAAVADAPRDAEPVDEKEDVEAEADKATGELPEPQAEQPAEDEPAALAAHDETEPRCSTAQQKKLGEALTAAGYTNKAQMMNYVTEWAQRPIGASKELSETEAVTLTGELWERVDQTANPS